MLFNVFWLSFAHNGMCVYYDVIKVTETVRIFNSWFYFIGCGTFYVYILLLMVCVYVLCMAYSFHGLIYTRTNIFGIEKKELSF